MQSVGQVAQDLQSELDSMKGITIFAPTNEAFSKVTSQLNTIGPDEMKAIIGQHVIQNRVVYSSLLKSQGSMGEYSAWSCEMRAFADENPLHLIQSRQADKTWFSMRTR